MLFVRSTNHTVKVSLEAKTETEEASTHPWWPAPDVLEEAERRFALVATTHDRNIGSRKTSTDVNLESQLKAVFSSSEVGGPGARQTQINAAQLQVG